MSVDPRSLVTDTRHRYDLQMRWGMMVACVCVLASGCGADDGSADDASSGEATDAVSSTSAASESSATSSPTSTTQGSTAPSDGETSASTTDETATTTSSGDPTTTTMTTTTTGAVGDGGSFEWRVNEKGPQEYGHQLEIPSGFGEGEFTMQLWIKPDDQLPVGEISSETIRTHWSVSDEMPYADSTWWYRGNFLLDGHNNAAGFSLGTFSLQFYGGGRLRWLFGDESDVLGGVRSAGAFPADSTPTLLDGNWHHVTLVRRWVGEQDADLELWIDGSLVDAETTNLRTNMRSFWDDWVGFGGLQDGWFWGAEKQAAVGKLPEYEDYKGLMAEVLFWDHALEPGAIESDFAAPIAGDESGLVGYYPWGQRSGTEVCDVITLDCSTLYRTDDTQWVAEGPPLQR